MTSRRNSNNSFDQDDQSTDTNTSNHSHLSKNSTEVYLARIQQETHRLRKKRKDHCDSFDNSDEPQQQHIGRTAAAAERLVSELAIGRISSSSQQQQQ